MLEPALTMQVSSLAVDVAVQYRPAIEQASSGQVSPIELAAGVAVQSPQHYLEQTYPYKKGGSVGLTQITAGEAGYFADKQFRPDDPTWAIQTLSNKMAAAADACVGCNSSDRFIAVGIGQNQGIGTIKLGSNGLVDWNTYFQRDSTYNDGMRWDVTLRKRINQEPSWTRANLRMFISAVDQLLAGGNWSLPEGVNLDYARCIANQGTSCAP